MRATHATGRPAPESGRYGAAARRPTNESEYANQRPDDT
ncbi:hypothetical protein OH687_26115 [Burkholderia anthina]|nr:hypothetical protein OH687_26115 [Burkholderia anthina]